MGMGARGRDRPTESNRSLNDLLSKKPKPEMGHFFLTLGPIHLRCTTHSGGRPPATHDDAPKFRPKYTHLCNLVSALSFMFS